MWIIYLVVILIMILFGAISLINLRSESWDAGSEDGLYSPVRF